MAAVLKWLPEPVSAQKDVKVLHDVRAALEADWTAKKEGDTIEALESSLGYLSSVNSALQSRVKFPFEELMPLCQLQLDIILASQHAPAISARWVHVLHGALRTYVKMEMEWEVQWRPLHDLMHTLLFTRSQAYESPVLLQASQETMVCLVEDLRGFFPPGSAAEIWEELSPALRNYHRPEAFTALGQLALFLPFSTMGDGRKTGDWGAWALIWLDMWDSVANCSFWDCWWMNIFVNLARHDSHALVDWGPLLPRLYTHIGWTFRLPVGSATADPPFGKNAVGLAQSVFKRDVNIDAGWLAIFLLGRVPSPAKGITAATAHDASASERQAVSGNGVGGAVEAGDVALEHLQTLVSLIETYFHPSNSGSWNGTLRHFLLELALAFCIRIEQDQARSYALTFGNGGGSSSDSPWDPSSLAVGPKKLSRIRNGPKLPESTREAVVDLLIRLGSTAQYSKDPRLAEAAGSLLCDCMYHAPHKALPLVCTRFQVALETVTATHQLKTAIESLADSVRLLISVGLEATSIDEMDVDGQSSQNGDGEAAARKERAADMIAGAMQALLPAIDANDEAKSTECFRFFAIVLSSVPIIPESGTPGVLPMDMEVWAEQLLQRVLGAIAALDAPDNRASDQASASGGGGHGGVSFLLQSMFRQVMELLFSRLAPGPRRRAIAQVARWATTTTLASVADEASVVVHAAVNADPALVCELLLLPLLGRLEDELASAAAAGSDQLSKAQQASLRWDLGLLRAVVYFMGPHLLPSAARLIALLQSAFSIPSRDVHEAASCVLSDALAGTTSFYPLDQFAPVPGGDPEAFEPWRTKHRWAEHTPPKWHHPSDAELEFANGLVDTLLLGPARQLAAIAGEPDVGAAWMVRRGRVRALLWCCEGVLSGARTMLPDFHQRSGLEGERIGQLLDWAGARDTVGEALLALFPVIPQSDAETLRILVQTIERLMAPSSDVYAAHVGSRQVCMALTADCCENYDHTLAIEAATGAGLRPRIPRWLLVERSLVEMFRRAAAAGRAPATSPACPVAPLAAVPPTYKALVEALLGLALGPFRTEASSARGALKHALKRFPALAPALLPPLLLALVGKTEGGGIPRLADEGITPQLLERLRAEMLSSSADARDDLITEGLIQGAVSTLQLRPLFRVINRSTAAFGAASAAAVAACREGGAATTAAVTELFFVLVIRVIRTPRMRAAQMGLCHLPMELADLFNDLQNLVASAPSSEAASGGVVHWRKALFADVLLLLLSPLPAPEAAGAQAAHMLATLTCDVTARRNLAYAALGGYLPASPQEAAQQGESGRAICAAAEAALQCPGFAKEALKLMAHAHPASKSDTSASKRLEQALASRDEAAARWLGSFYWRLDTWPARPAAEQEGTYFIVSQAKLWRGLALAAPGQVLAAIKAPLQAALSGSQDDDRPATSSASEALAGLLASGVPFRGDAAPWEEWLGPLLTSAMAAAPLDLADSWALALRFGVNGLGEATGDGAARGLAALLHIIATPTAPGAPSSAVIKRLRLLHHALLELSTLQVSESHREAPQPSASSMADEDNNQHSNSTTANGHKTHSSTETAGGASLNGGAISSGNGNGIGIDRNGPGSEGGVSGGREGDTWAPAAAELLQEVLEELPALAALPSEAIQEEVARVAAAACSLAVTRSLESGTDAPAVSTFCASVQAVLQTSAAFVQQYVSGAADGSGETSQLSAAGGQTGRMEMTGVTPSVTPSVVSDEVSMEEGDRATLARAEDGFVGKNQGVVGMDQGVSGKHQVAEATQRLGFALAFLKKTLHSGEGALLRDHLLPFLPPLLQLQELKLPELQRLELASKTALAMLKYLPLASTAAASRAAHMVEGGAGAPLWTARGATLSWAQYFWFRHVFLLPPQESKCLLDLAERMLGDPKMEVADVAAATLSGFLRAAPPAAAAAARARYMAAVQDGMASHRLKRRRRKDGLADGQSDSAGGGMGLHAAVLGLQAAAATAPYHVPDWLPDLLVTVAGAASAPGAAGKAARATLASFRRTHEPAALLEARTRLGEDRWEAITEFEGGREGGFA